MDDIHNFIIYFKIEIMLEGNNETHGKRLSIPKLNWQISCLHRRMAHSPISVERDANLEKSIRNIGDQDYLQHRRT